MLGQCAVSTPWACPRLNPRGETRPVSIRAFGNHDPGPWGVRSAMSTIVRDRVRKQLHEAEGYLMLELPRHALAILESRPDWFGMQFEACFLKGEALRS